MMIDILLDMGPRWNHVLPLSTLRSISHIEMVQDRYHGVNFIKVECTIEHGDTERIITFTSDTSFNMDELDKEKARLLGLSNGIISKSDMQQIIKTMELQTGKKLSITLDQPIYDMHYIRRIWASVNNEPFFRFILQYDHKEQTINAVEEHNDNFTAILGDWLDDHTMKLVTDLDDRLLIFAYNAIDRMAEPIMPMNDGDEFLDPNADIPVMGDASRGLATQQVDLGKLDNSDIMMTS